MTHPEPVLPVDDEEIYFAYLLMDSSFALTARHYSCDESLVHRRIDHVILRAQTEDIR